MNYKLDFLEEALAEWNKLNPSIKQPLKKKLIKVLENPRIPKTSCQDILIATRSNFVVLVIVWFMKSLMMR